jgi:AcrR family transcriptional regulator
MGRRGDHGLVKIKEMALEAAEALVADGGIGQLSTRKVAAKIGYSAGTLYLVFKDFNELVLQVNGRTMDKLHMAIVAAGEKQTKHEKAVQAVCRAYYDFAESHPALWSLLFDRRWGPDTARPDWYQAKIRDCFEPLVERLKALGLGRDSRHLDALTRALWASVHGTCVLRQDNNISVAGVRESSKLLDLQVSLFLRGAKA